MTRKTGYLANITNVPPLIFRFQFNPEILVEKKAYKYKQANNFGKFDLDKAQSATGVLATLGGFMDDIKEVGTILTDTKPLETVEGEPRVFQIDFSLDDADGGRGEGEPTITQDLAVLRSFMYPGLDYVKTVSEAFQGKMPCYDKPPECTLKYGGLSVLCVMTNLNIKMIRFKDDGTPGRVEVTVTLKEQTFSVGAVIDTAVRAGYATAALVRPSFWEDLNYVAFPTFVADPIAGIFE